MRYMVLMIPRDNSFERGEMPSKEAIVPMMKYNEELADAGVLIGLDGLHATAKGARVKFESGGQTVIDGPFVGTSEIVGGYWMLQVKSKDEAIAWAKKCPAAEGDIMEIRQVFEMSDFPTEIQDEAAKKRVGAYLKTVKQTK